MSNEDLRDVLLERTPPAREHIRNVLIRDQADRDAISSRLMRYRGQNGQGWADIIDMLTMHPELRQRVVRLLAEIDGFGPERALHLHPPQPSSRDIPEPRAPERAVRSQKRRRTEVGLARFRHGQCGGARGQRRGGSGRTPDALRRDL
jgi:hypothetical protein